MPRQSKQAQIDELERTLKYEQGGIEGLRKEIAWLHQTVDMHKKRVGEIAAENEELRMDKKWLKTLVQNLTGNNNALPR